MKEKETFIKTAVRKSGRMEGEAMRKRLRMKKAGVSLILSMALFAGIFSGCSQGEENTDTQNTQNTVQEGTTEGNQEAAGEEFVPDPENPFLISNTPVTLDILVTQNDDSLQPEEQWLWKFLEERTGVHFNIQSVASSVWAEQKNIIMASGDLPDIFLLYSGTFEPYEIVSYGQKNGMFLSLNDYIEQYAPDIKRELDEDPEARKAVTLPDGNIYSIPALRVGVDNIQVDGSAVGNTWINKSWMDKVGMSEPETLDDFYELLKAFKEQDPNGNGAADEIPFIATKTSTCPAIVLRAFGFNTDGTSNLCVKDGQATIPAADPLYEEYLRYMNKLYTEGLIDRNMFTQDATGARAKCAQNQVGAIQTTAAFTEFPDTYEDYICMSPLTSEWNDEKILTRMSTVSPITMVISADTQYPDVAIRFANLFFLDMLNPIIEGPEKGSGDELGFGGHYANEDGTINFDMPENCGSHWEYRYKYLGVYDGATPGLNNSEYRGEKYDFPEPDRLFREAVYATNPKQYFVPAFPTLYMSEEDAERCNSLITPIKDYISSMEAKYISGTESLDTIDTFFEELKNLGVEEYIQINQKYYESWEE